MRDLSRRHAKEPAYKLLTAMGFEVFTPMTRKLVIENGQRKSKEEPFMQDLLFVHDVRERLTPIVRKIENLQYRYIRGGYCEPMVVPDADMERFIHAVTVTDAPKYYLPEEITPNMCNRRIRIMGGPLDGYEGFLLTTRGSKVKRLFIELPGFLSVGVEVNLDYIQLLK